MKTFLKISWPAVGRVALEAVVSFAAAGVLLEWRHPGLVSDVVPWSAVAGLAIALALGLAWTSHRPPPPARLAAAVPAVIAAAASAAVAYGYFAPIPRFQPWLAAAAGLTVLLSACLFTYHQPQP